jgi:DNA-binding transcriptional regulator LsrR (DeoR family)
MTIFEGFEYYFPKQGNPVVKTVVCIYPTVERRYGQAVEVLQAEITDDWGVGDVWKVSELEDSLAKGFCVPYENAVPAKARKKLQHLAVGALATHLDPKDMVAVVTHGRTVYAGVTTWRRALVGLVDGDGKIVRKRAVIDDATAMLRQAGIIAQP